MRKRDFFHTGLDVSRSEIASMRGQHGGGIPAGSEIGAADYYVDGNVAFTGDGSLNYPFSTLSEAIAASNTSIGLRDNRWWARRNRIFAMGDHELTEDLTIFPEKCDIIGVGYDVEPGPTLTGHHTIAAVATGMARSTRWYNFRFQNDDAGECIHLPTLSPAVEFHGCTFEPLATGSTHAVRLADDNRGFKMIGSRILVSVAGAPAAGIFAEGIKVEGNGQHDMIIANNYIHATEGIHIVAGTAGYNGIIDNNRIRATALTINDASGLFAVTNNNLHTAAIANVAAGALGIVCEILYASGNKLTGANTGAENADYPFVVALTS
jgi:hypothetical protein